MAEETDGVREAFDDALRVALTVATQLGERVARLREQFGRQREARAVQTNRELTARFEAERAAMQASLIPLKQESWWDRASITDIANARETATAWSDFDDVAREASVAIQREVHERFGVDVRQPDADPTETAEAFRTAQAERAELLAKRESEGEELTAAEMLLLAAERRDRESAPSASREQLDYDSEARRDEFAASLAGAIAPDTIAARILADGENARHPSEAVRNLSLNSPNLKRGKPANARTRVKDRNLGR